MKNYISYSIIGIVLLLNACNMSDKEEVDLIIKNGSVYTVNNDFEIVDALAVNNGKIVAVGTDDMINNKYTSDSVFDATDLFVYPGFNDGHSHFLGYGIMKTQYADLVNTKSFDEICKRLVDHHNNYPTEWILGRGWDQNDWEIKEFPEKEELDKLFPDNPVMLTRVDGHAVIVNSKAMALAGINAKTAVDGGEVVLKNGEPTGVLIDNAIEIVREKVPVPDVAEKTAALLEAQKNCFARGLTTITDAGLDKADVMLIDDLQKTGKLKIKAYVMLSPNAENLDYFLVREPIRNGSLTVSSVKMYADGALGSRGALLLKPYSDAPEVTGLQLHKKAFYDSICKMAYDAGYQINTHAIGDSGNRLMLEVYSEVLGGKNDRRWRIEHSQIVDKEDFHYFGDYSIIPSIQATHCTSDMYWADERLGEERIKNAYAYQQLLDENGWFVNGTDFPIEDICPLKTFYAAVARKDLAGWPDGGFQSENAISREDALRSITIWPAKGSFDEENRGSIEVGKSADIVILNKDLLNCDEMEIPNLKIISTFVNGEKVY